jgi:hypothetical protein
MADLEREFNAAVVADNPAEMRAVLDRAPGPAARAALVNATVWNDTMIAAAVSRNALAALELLLAEGADPLAGRESLVMKNLCGYSASARCARLAISVVADACKRAGQPFPDVRLMLAALDPDVPDEDVLQCLSGLPRAEAAALGACPRCVHLL